MMLVFYQWIVWVYLGLSIVEWLFWTVFFLLGFIIIRYSHAEWYSSLINWLISSLPPLNKNSLFFGSHKKMKMLKYLFFLVNACTFVNGSNVIIDGASGVCDPLTLLKKICPLYRNEVVQANCQITEDGV